MTSEHGQPTLQALVFDAYGTIFDVNAVADECETIYPGHGQALTRLWRAKQLEYSWLLSLMGRYEDFWQVTERALAYSCRALLLPDEPIARSPLMDAYLRLPVFSDVPEALDSLSGYRLAILSNGSPEMLSAVVARNRLTEAFAYVISVDEVGIYKPSARVYELAARKLEVDAESIGFVSANAFDVAGAKSFGLWTCWVNRTEATFDELDLPPDLIVGDLAELSGVLKRQ